MLPTSTPIMRGSYSYDLVALSFFIAAMASYAAFNLADRVAIHHHRKRFAWLAGGALAMGIGIWSMHYTGMLAFRLPVVVTYHVPTVALSLFAAVSGSAVALAIVSRDRLDHWSLLLGALALGAAIGTMHYIGMAAMRGPMSCHYSASLVTLSLVVAFLFSCLALWLMFRFRQPRARSTWLKLTAATMMGSGIAFMHYTAMAAASFTPSEAPSDTLWAVSVSRLAVAGIGAATILLLIGASLTSWLDRQLALERIAQQVLESVQIVLWRADPYSLRLNFLSSSAGKVLGSDVNLNERTSLWIDHIHPDDLQNVLSQYEIAARTKEPLQTEYRFIKSDGHTIWLREVVRSTTGRGSRHLMGTTRDITDSKALEQALIAGEKLAALGRLSATIAHEINNPLQAALNLIHVADKVSDPQKHEFLKSAAQELRRAADISRITLGFYKGGDSYSLVNFGRIARDLAFLYEPRLRNKDVKLAATISEQASLWASEGEIRQILSNLISNALDAVLQHGTINLRISPAKDWRKGSQSGVRMTLVDNGQGFDAEALNRAFMPFFTTKTDTGTGLGLWVVRQLADKYHGHITVRSNQAPLRHGTAISIFLPSQPQQENILAEQPAEANSRP